jgi:hypothetical protein
VIRFVCWHPVHGYLRFASYSSARGTVDPDPRACFVKRKDAERRRDQTLYISRKPVLGSEIEIRQVRWTFEVISG